MINWMVYRILGLFSIIFGIAGIILSSGNYTTGRVVLNESSFYANYGGFVGLAFILAGFLLISKKIAFK